MVRCVPERLVELSSISILTMRMDKHLISLSVFSRYNSFRESTTKDGTSEHINLNLMKSSIGNERM